MCNRRWLRDQYKCAIQMCIGDGCENNNNVHWGWLQEQHKCALGMVARMMPFSDISIQISVSINMSLLQNDEKNKIIFHSYLIEVVSPRYLS